MTRKQQNTESVESAEAVEVLSPYAAARLVNDRLAAEGIDKKIPPQMMYNYTYGRINAGKSPLIKASRTAGVDREDFERWLNAYIEKQRPSTAEAEVAEEAEVVEAE